MESAAQDGRRGVGSSCAGEKTGDHCKIIRIELLYPTFECS